MKHGVEKTHQDIETDLYLFEFGIVALIIPKFSG